MTPPDETEHLLHRHQEGEEEALDRLIGRYRDRVRKEVLPRLGKRLERRIDASDVVQEVCFEAARRAPRDLVAPDMPFSGWMRFLAHQKVRELERRHLGAAKRDLRREVPIEDDAASQAGFDPAASITQPGEAMARDERASRLHLALAALTEEDRHVISLRHDEGLGNVEAAERLGIAPAAASKRYLRALQRLKALLAEGTSEADDLG